MNVNLKLPHRQAQLHKTAPSFQHVGMKVQIHNAVTYITLLLFDNSTKRKTKEKRNKREQKLKHFRSYKQRGLQQNFEKE
jgi:hypothetical protein